MNELIKLTTSKIGNEAQQTVNARDLHDFLEVKSNFRDWIKNRIETVGFTEGVDFVSFDKNLAKHEGGRPSIEYAISINMAKELAMLERNAKGKQARLYFIECEKVAKEAIAYGGFKVPKTMLEALQLAVQELEKNNAMKKQLEMNAPKVEFADAVTLQGGSEMTITVAAKTLDLRPKKFFDWLRLEGFLYKQGNQATQVSINKGYMVTRFAAINHNSTQEVEQRPYARITGKGLFYFYHRLRKDKLIAKNDELELAA